MDRVIGPEVFVFWLSTLSTWGKKDVSVAHILISFQEDMRVNIASSRYSFSLTRKIMKQENYLLFVLVTTVQSVVVV